MKALILNSGTGRRMGDATKSIPKCMTQLVGNETVLGRQLHQIAKTRINEVVITTGAFDNEIRDYCESLYLPLRFHFVKNELYDQTNYIYSMYLARDLIDDDLLLLHGDLVFDDMVLNHLMEQHGSCIAVSCSATLPKKDFKAVVADGRITKIGIEFFNDAIAVQPLYKLEYADWCNWKGGIERLCEEGERNCYAENAFNSLTEQFPLHPLDVKKLLCMEIDTLEDLHNVQLRLSDKAVQQFEADDITW